MLIRKRLFCCWLLCALANVTIGQATGTTLVAQQFDNYRKHSLVEKMFVHTDKDFYLAGEIMWFKIYAMDGSFHRPLSLGNVAYVELLDANNNPLLQAKIKMEDGSGYGSLSVPLTINSGNYKFRSYSNWMKNFGPDYFFEKQVTIINTQKASDLQTPKSKPAFDIHFYPEGGNLVNGLESKVAFGVTDQSGKGIDCGGVIINDRRDTVARFQTLKFGLGNFNFTPQPDQSYTALATLSNGARITEQLPKAYNSGHVLHLDASDPATIKITVKYKGDVAQRSPATVFLFAHTRSTINTSTSMPLQNGIAVFTINKQKLGEGITHFTLFDANQQPVCERLYFKYPSQQLLINAKADAASYSRRKKIKIDIANTGQVGKSTGADMSMAVYRVDSLQAPGKQNINEYLWLSSDLGSNIESPEYYFDAGSASKEQAMDNLVLTKGWRRFRWEDILQNKTPAFRYLPELNGHVVHGKIINSANGTPGVNINSFLSAPGSNTIFRTALSDDSGKVKFEMQNFYGSPAIIVQPTPGLSSNYHIEVENPFLSQYSQWAMAPFTIPAGNPVTLLDRSIGVQVENLYHAEKRDKIVYGFSDTVPFYQKPNELYLLDNYTRFTTMEEVLREYVMSVNVRRRSGRYHLPVYNDADPINKIFDKDPLVLLDGVPVFDLDKLMRYDPLKVRKMETVTRRYYFGNLSFEGIVNLSTYDGGIEGYELDPGATVIDYEALQLHREFYSPVYETPQQVSSHAPDFRNVLYWQPSLKAGIGGTAQTSFYSSDLPGKYVVVVQGIDKTGKAGSGMAYFEVK